MKTNKLWSILMMLTLVLGTTISFSSCSGDDDDSPSGGGSKSGGGASASSVPGSYTGITSDRIKSLNAIFTEDGTGVINENGKHHTFTYFMGRDTGIAKVTDEVIGSSHFETTYTIKFIEGFMLFEESNGVVRYFFYKTGQNLGSPKAKKLIGNWEGNWVNNDGDIFKYNCTFNSDGTGTFVEDETDTDGDHYEYKETFTYKMENAYVARIKDWYDDDCFIVLNNKVYLYGKIARAILSKK